jgi:HlyD family secretion protein
MKKIKWLIGILLFIAAGVAVWYWKFRTAPTELLLTTVKPEYGTISNAVTATGTLQPVDTVAVGTQVSGIIEKVYVDFNSTVKKGQLLAQLDKSLLLAQVQQINANLLSAKANYSYLKSNLERQQQLYTAGAVSKAEQEAAQYQYSSAAQTVSSINAQLSSAQRNLSFTNIYSPIDGTVLARSVSEGQTVAASLSTPTLFSIAKDLAKMQVQAAVDEADIGYVKKGLRVVFTVDAFPADTFHGTVKEVRLRSSVSANVVSYVTIIDAPNETLKLKPGMTASISIFTRESSQGLVIPARALSFKPDAVLLKKYPADSSLHKAPALPDSMEGKTANVWLIKENRLVRQQVITGMDDETQVQVLTGLSKDDEIVTGYTEQKVQKTATSEKSPFMPQRPGGNQQKRNTGPPPQ